MNNKTHEHWKWPTPVKSKSKNANKQKRKRLVTGFTNGGLASSRGLDTNKVLGTSLREDIEMEEDPGQENHSNSKNNDYDLADISKDQMQHQHMVIERLVRKLFHLRRLVVSFFSSYCLLLIQNIIV